MKNKDILVKFSGGKKVNIKLIVFDNIFRFAIPNIHLPQKVNHAFKCKSL